MTCKTVVKVLNIKFKENPIVVLGLHKPYTCADGWMQLTFSVCALRESECVALGVK
jgi:hypothetical protein